MVRPARGGLAAFGGVGYGYAAYEMADTPSSILLIADPGVPAVIAERLSDSLPNALTDRAPADAKWDVSVRRHSYPFDEHAEVLEVIRTVDPAGETEDVVIYLTDL
ncbi:MAG: hypothetical protein QOK33_4196, partial [Mycobacterium sp.]|nr:hypothetical protein [Mycobacterium sp.]